MGTFWIDQDEGHAGATETVQFIGDIVGKSGVIANERHGFDFLDPLAEAYVPLLPKKFDFGQFRHGAKYRAGLEVEQRTRWG